MVYCESDLRPSIYYLWFICYESFSSMHIVNMTDHDRAMTMQPGVVVAVIITVFVMCLTGVVITIITFLWRIRTTSEMQQ